MFKRLLLLILPVIVAVSPALTMPASATTYYGKSISDRPPVSYTTHAQNRDSANPDAANTYTSRIFPSTVPTGFHYSRMDASMQTWNTSDTTGYFYASSYYFANGSDFGGYIGVQTRMINCLPTCTNVGHGVVASIWGATAATPTPGLPVIAVSDTEVGAPFKSLHFTYNWIPGHLYRTAIIQDETRRCLNCGTLWTAGIVDDSVGGYTIFGTFLLPDNQNRMLPSSIAFSEEYTPNSYPACNPPYSRTDWNSSHYMIATDGGFGATPAIFSTSFNDYVQTGTGCTNSNSYSIGSTQRHVIGATV